MRKVLTLSFVVLALAVAPAALAASGSGATTEGYGGQSTIQQTLGGSSGTPPTTSGALPFTGVDLGVIIAAGVVLLVMGVGLRRVSRRIDA